MSAEVPALVRTFAVGRRYRCTITMRKPIPGTVGSTLFEWEPDVPKNLTKAELRDYRAGRDAAVAELAQMFGIQVALVET